MVRGLLITVVLAAALVGGLTMINGSKLTSANKIPSISVGPNGQTTTTTVSSLGGPIGAAEDTQAKQNLTIAYQAASEDAVSNGDGKFAAPAALAAAIHDGEPEITVVVGHASAASGSTVAIDPESTPSQVILYAHSSSGATFEMKGAPNGSSSVTQVG